MELGLVRVHELLDRLDHPEKHLGLVVHVAGTNGKGSVCAYVSTCLAFAGYKVGRYTSPFLIDPRDSICILNKDSLNLAHISMTGDTCSPVPFAVEDRLFTAIQDEVLQQCDSMTHRPTSFEMLTAIAFCIFRKENVDVSVIEVGLGGSDDATNVFDRPGIVVITSIGYDHQALLGPTLETIASKKAGIIRPDCPTVIARQTYAEAEQTLLRYATFPITLLRTLPDDQTVILPDGSQVRPPLRGAHQTDNLCAALTALTFLHGSGHLPRLEPSLIDEALNYCYWPGRLSEYSWRDGKVSVIVDGAHNIDGVYALRNYLNEKEKIREASPPDEATHSSTTRSMDYRRPIHWLFGCIRDKPYESMLGSLVRAGDMITFTEFTVPPMMNWIRPASTTQLCAWARRSYGNSMKVNEVSTAAEFLSQFSCMSNVYIVICGSLYLVADFYRYFETHRKEFMIL
jgi:dihydrofolate synthase / folylpolyglutamate synthase